MQTPNFLRTFGEAFRQGCRNCFQSVQWSVICKKTLFWEISSFLHVFGLSVKKNEDRWRKSFARASNEKPMYLDDCSRKTTLVVRKTLSCIFEPSVKKVWEIDEIISAVVFEKGFTFPEKNFARNFFFVKIMFFFQFFSTLSYLFSISLLKFAAGISKDWSGYPTKNFVWKTFFKIVSFCNFCRHRISFGLSAKLFDRVAETIFRVFSGALSAKRQFSWNFLLFACFRTLSEIKWGPLAKKLRKSFKWEIYVFRWLFEKHNACC